MHESKCVLPSMRCIYILPAVLTQVKSRRVCDGSLTETRNQWRAARHGFLVADLAAVTNALRPCGFLNGLDVFAGWNTVESVQYRFTRSAAHS